MTLNLTLLKTLQFIQFKMESAEEEAARIAEKLAMEQKIKKQLEYLIILIYKKKKNLFQRKKLLVMTHVHAEVVKSINSAAVRVVLKKVRLLLENIDSSIPSKKIS